jgi:hypothetical protein
MVFLESLKLNSGTEPSRLRVKPIGTPDATFGEELEANTNTYIDSLGSHDRAYFDTYEEHIKSLRSLGINDRDLINPERRYQAERGLMRFGESTEGRRTHGATYRSAEIGSNGRGVEKDAAVWRRAWSGRASPRHPALVSRRLLCARSNDGNRDQGRNDPDNAVSCDEERPAVGGHGGRSDFSAPSVDPE